MHCEMVQRLKALVDPLLSDKEEAKELNSDAHMDTYLATNHLDETKNGWAHLQYDRGLALESVPVPCEEDIPHSAVSAIGTKAYLVSNDARLTNGRCEALSDCSGDGSDGQSSDGSDSDVGTRDEGVRFDQLPVLPEYESDNGDWQASALPCIGTPSDTAAMQGKDLNQPTPDHANTATAKSKAPLGFTALKSLWRKGGRSFRSYTMRSPVLYCELIHCVSGGSSERVSE